MSWIKSAWDVLNGKKLTIGALVLLGIKVLRMTEFAEWAEPIEQFLKILEDAGWLTLAVGATHKGVKKVSG